MCVYVCVSSIAQNAASLPLSLPSPGSSYRHRPQSPPAARRSLPPFPAPGVASVRVRPHIRPSSASVYLAGLPVMSSTAVDRMEEVAPLLMSARVASSAVTHCPNSSIVIVIVHTRPRPTATAAAPPTPELFVRIKMSLQWSFAIRMLPAILIKQTKICWFISV